MRLKTLEIKGFKSFADKTVINFDERITGVVGPNGCGKSNIVDSIRWVIGEHRISQLRSENLDGLLFNGSKSRSASGLAEVSLTFENTRNVLPTEFTTVTITRKFFKNGESEYRLNDVVCRLKDIHNLFLDTGVTTDSYSIIEPGMVEDLIKDKDNSRRRMLEQAAGISIYKTRRKEAALKLEATEADLNRIEDLLFEINNNLKTLESQARKAQRYNDIKKEYRELSIELAKASLEGFNLSYQELTGEMESAQSLRLELDAGIASSEAVLEQDKLILLGQEKLLQETQKQFNELLAVIRNAEQEKSLAAQQINYLEDRRSQLQQFLDGASGQLGELEQTGARMQSRLAEESLAMETAKQTLEALRLRAEEDKSTFGSKKLERDDQRSALARIQRSQFEAEKTVAVAETSISNLTQALGQVTAEKEAQRNQLGRMGEEKTKLEVELKDRRVVLEGLLSAQASLRENILATQSEMETLREELGEATRSLDAKKNEHDLLKSMVDSLEGYPESIKFLNRNADWPTGAPLLCDVFSCQEEYRPAIENLLEPYLNYYLVHDPREALEAIRLLDEHHKGKANFFILDRFRQKDPVRPVTPEGTIPALDLVELDASYKGLGEYLLGQVFVTTNGSSLEDVPPGAVIVDKSGKLLRGQYHIQGGSLGLFEGKKLGRAKHLDALESQIQNLLENVAAIRARMEEKQRQIQGYQDKLSEPQVEQARAGLDGMQQTLFALESRMEHVLHLLEGSVARIGEMEESLAANRGQMNGAREGLTTITQDLAGAEQAMVVAEDEYRLAEYRFNQASDKFNEENLAHARQQSRVQSLVQELEFNRRQATDLDQQIQANVRLLDQSTSGIVSASQKIDEMDTTLLEHYRNKEQQEQQLAIADQQYYQFRAQVSDAESGIRLRHREREQTEQLLGAIKDRLNELKLQVSSMKERLSVEFRVVLDEILDQPRTGQQPLEELQAGAEKFRKRLENMGEINPMAIEAFQEVTKRYEFILDQKNDLVTARESLMKTIGEVEATANQKFLDTFHQVKENFAQVFKALFTEEDQCDLIMTDPDNLAETNIEVIAKPKGKKPTVINQLSGGEKTMVATALLFAIYLIKPAPFCILDEVDAPLDDFNVAKFTQMIRQFSDNSQFIVVTHNKQTMAAVDVIYGVTMQEAGVSKLVPVDFRSLN